MLFAFVAILVICASTHAGATSQGGKDTSFSSDIHEATNLLAKAKFDFPAEGAKLWEKNDGLLMPQDPQFARNAARFLAEHPIPPAEHRNQALWDTCNTASRQLKCLTYLASGKKEGRQEVAGLCITQAMQMQWTLPLHAGYGPRHCIDHTFYSATGALSLTGGLLVNNAKKNSFVYEMAREWLLTGRAQFASHGHRGNKIERNAAKALIDTAHVKADALEIHGTDQEFFSQLDLERQDMREVARQVASGDWQHARKAYVEALVRRFSSKRGWPDLAAFGDLVASKAVNTAEADDICRNIFILRAHMFRRYDYGEKVQWDKMIDNDLESRVWMNAHPWMVTLMGAYRKTGDKKYIRHLCRLFNSWYEDSPPTFKRSSAQWRTLEAGNRAGRAWSVVLLGLSGYPTFKRESLFNMARSMLDHGKYLCTHTRRVGNWLQVEASGLACVALLFPEFKLSPTLYDVAVKRLTWANAGTFLPDGFQSECSTLYHLFPLDAMANACRLANSLKMPMPDSLLKQYEAGVEVLQYISYPDRLLSLLSDANPTRCSVIGIVQAGAEVFDRDDFRWLATNGREGKPPAETSHDFTHAGYCVMRDRWGPEGQVLIFDAGYLGLKHEHEDKLNFVYYAGGRELIGDPGIYSYKRDEFEPYWRGTWSHNSVVIDGLSQHRRLGPSEDIPDPDRRFIIGEDFDFATGWYRRAYSPRTSYSPIDKSDKAASIRNVEHQRIVFCVKGEYAVICDRVLGEGEHQVDIIFHPAPIVTGEGTKRTVRAVDLEIESNGRVITKEREHANVAIIPAQDKNLEVLDLIGRKDPVRGWYALYGLIPSHDIVYRCHTELPRHFETVIEPLPPGYTQPMKVESRQVNCEEGKTCAALKCASDMFLICYDGPTEMSCADIRFHGTALMLTLDASRRPVQALMVDGRALSIGGNQIFSTDTPMPARSIELHTISNSRHF
jgi:hypothetical protein